MSDDAEAHRIGTIGRWDAPDAEWATEYDWTRYRGPEAYPVPGAWVLNIVEGDGIIWYRYPMHGEGVGNDTDAYEEYPDDGTYNDDRDASASLGNEIVDEDRRAREVTLEQKLTIAGTTVFRRVEPDSDELYANVARALAQYDDGDIPEEIAVSWQTGRLPDDVAREQELQKRTEENQSLGDFA